MSTELQAANTTSIIISNAMPDGSGAEKQASAVRWPPGLVDSLRDAPSSFLGDGEASDVSSKHDDGEVVQGLKTIRPATGQSQDAQDHSLRSDPHDHEKSLRSDKGALTTTDRDPQHSAFTPFISSTFQSSADPLSTSQPGNASLVPRKGPSGNAPVKIRNVYVAALPLNFSEADLINLLSPFGAVKSCRMFSETDRVAEIGRAYGFALFEHAGSAEAAVAKLDGTGLGLSRIQVRLSRNGVVKKPKDWRERERKTPGHNAETPIQAPHPTTMSIAPPPMPMTDISRNATIAAPTQPYPMYAATPQYASTPQYAPPQHAVLPPPGYAYSASAFAPPPPTGALGTQAAFASGHIMLPPQPTIAPPMYAPYSAPQYIQYQQHPAAAAPPPFYYNPPMQPTAMPLPPHATPPTAPQYAQFPPPTAGPQQQPVYYVVMQ
jgi:RNA recognition motif-containing protein